MRLIKRLILDGLYYDQNNLWVKLDGSLAIVGMTDYGQKNTGDILYLELAAPGTRIVCGEKCGSIESGKWVGNLTAPLSGTIIESNTRVEQNPRLVNADAFGEGWLYRLEISNHEEVNSLLNAREYAEWTAAQDAREEEMG